MKRRDFPGKIVIAAGSTAAGNVIPTRGAEDEQTRAFEMKNNEME